LLDPFLTHWNYVCWVEIGEGPAKKFPVGIRPKNPKSDMWDSFNCQTIISGLIKHICTSPGVPDIRTPPIPPNRPEVDANCLQMSGICLRSSADRSPSNTGPGFREHWSCLGHSDICMPTGGWIQSLLCGPANTSDGWWCALDWIYRQGADDAGFGSRQLVKTANYFRYLIAFCQKQFALDEPMAPKSC